MLTSERVKQLAYSLGADLVGIGTMDRFEGTPPESDPRFIAPRAKSIVGLGFRVLRGSLRGVEEGTHFYQFPEMGIVHIDEVYAPGVLRRLACFLEDNGFEGVVQRSVPDRRRGEDPGSNPEHLPAFKIRFSEPVAPGRPAPDVLMNFNQAAQLCGLGSLGLGGFVLTAAFGPLQRFAFILTDAELEPDPVQGGRPCDGCGACITACPVSALGSDGKLDEWQCMGGRMGGDLSTNPFLSPEAVKADPEAARTISGGARFTEAGIAACKGLLEAAYPQVRFGYNPSLCGVACQRACLAHLEEKGVLGNRFATRFRDKALWKIPD